jgi:hypothetical protein
MFPATDATLAAISTDQKNRVARRTSSIGNPPVGGGHGVLSVLRT